MERIPFHVLPHPCPQSSSSQDSGVCALVSECLSVCYFGVWDWITLSRGLSWTL